MLERRSGRVVGVYRKKAKFGWVETEDPALDGQIDVHGDTTAEPGQLVVVDLEQWDKNKTPRGRILEVLGWPGDAGVEPAEGCGCRDSGGAPAWAVALAAIAAWRRRWRGSPSN